MTPRALRRTLAFGLMVCAVALFVAAGLRKVPPGHQGAVVRFGVLRPDLLAPGLHWATPWPIGEVRHVPTGTVRQIRLERPGQIGTDSRAAEYLTGDANFLNVALRIDYRVTDALEIARTGLDAVESRLTPLAESCLVSELATIAVADALGPGREGLARALKGRLQQQADRLALGIEVAGVVWIEIAPPPEVRRDFESAQTAVSEAASMVAEAEREAAEIVAASAGEAARIEAEAEARAESATAASRTEALSFTALLKQARRTGLMPTGRKLWLDTVAEILPKLKGRTVLATDQPVDLTIIRSAPPQDAPVSTEGP